MELLLLLVVGLIVLGPDRLPAALRAVGKVIGELRSVSDGVMRELTGPVRGRPAFPTYRPKIDRVAVQTTGQERAQQPQRSGGAPQEPCEDSRNMDHRDTPNNNTMK